MKENSYTRKKVGLPPGTILYTGNKINKEVSMELYSFDGNKVSRRKIEKDENLSILNEKGKLNWLNIDGLHDADLINKIGEELNINSLVLEDLANVNQRVKIEVWENYIFIVLKLTELNPKNKNIEYKQISFILGENYLLTFQEGNDKIFDALRKRIELPNSKIFYRGIGYLAYAMIDIIVDNYFVILDFLEEKIDGLERKILNEFSDKLAEKILKLKSELSYLKKGIYPIREISAKFQSEDVISYFGIKNKMYLSDLHDHGITICDILETMTSRTSELFQLYYSILSNDMNNVMKVLAIISTIFMPLSFLAGLYGMNFKYIPELNYQYGYFILLGIMVVLVVGMFIIFKKKKWL
ncbi:magnesium/cobalt transporter CorA [Fusobacterium sp.]|uniref:magnesium/cobalt transporter CorA n=1 Tax=Fusobacterium sp. TaxID=68766 RepID=UPI00261A0FDD|nr:magnesium/cobalt transporter CorA [Fusobacterium sp.]